MIAALVATLGALTSAAPRIEPVVSIGAVSFGAVPIGAVPVGVAPADGPVDGEFLVRDRAAALDASWDAIAADLASDDWRVRARGVQVLARTRDGDPERARDVVLRALEDAHPNVRAAAVAAAAMRRVDPGAARWDALAVDPLPATRSAVVRCLALVRPPDVGERLERLAHDADPRVADRAFRALLALGDAAAPNAAREWLRRDLPADPQRLLDATDALARGPRADALFAALEPGKGPLESALLAAAAARAGSPADPRAVLDGWFAPTGTDSVVVSIERDAQLLAGAEALGGDLARHLEQDVLALDAFAAGDEDAWRSRRPELARRIDAGDLSVEYCLDAWCEAFVASARGDGEVLNAAFRSLNDSSFTSLVEAAYGRLDRVASPWQPTAALRGFRESAHFAWTELVGEIYVRTRDEAAGDWLSVYLTTRFESCRREAFLALTSVPDLRPYQYGLSLPFRRMDDAARLSWLPRFSRRYPLPEFRGPLMGMWVRGARDVSVLELLAAFEGDEGVIQAFREWLDSELTALDRAARGAPTEWAPSEGVAKVLLEGLVRLGADDAVFVDALRRTDGLSEELAKRAAARLGTTAAGRAELVAYLAPARAQRVRLEAALALAPTGNDAAVRVLVEGYDACDEELQIRALRALGASGSEAGWTLPQRVAADRSAGAGARLVAFEVLGDARPSERGAAILLELAGPGNDLDGRRAALRALGRTGDPTALARLERFEVEAVGDELHRESLRDEWLYAGARCAGDAAPAWWLDAWSERPNGRARGALRERFRGDRVAAIDFTYRAELESAVARAADAEALLDGAGDFQRWDARFLFELGERWLATEAPAARRAARRVGRAAEVAAAGEGRMDDAALFHGRLRLRAIEAAMEDGRYAEAARRVEELLLDHRLGDLGERDWERLFGSDDRSAGRAPLAWVGALELHARARAALERDDPDAARALLERMRHLARDSERARAECDGLARAIRDRGE